jgi:hypothetical protein
MLNRTQVRAALCPAQALQSIDPLAFAYTVSRSVLITTMPSGMFKANQ